MERSRELVKKLYKTDKGEPFIMTDGQEEIFDLIFKKTYPRNHIETHTRYGKLISDDTPVLTKDGWKKHGELKIGDIVYNHFGNEVKVVAIGKKDYASLEIEFTNGEKIKVHPEHEWLIRHKEWRRKGKGFRVMQTNEILKYKIKTASHYNFLLPKIEPIKRDEKKLSIDPYTFGAWLGDGTSTKPWITCIDKEIIKKIPYKVNRIYIHKSTKVPSYSYYYTDFWKGLKKLNLIDNKHIPEIYKYSSIKQRLELLAGIIDTDGSVRNGLRDGWDDIRVLITNTNKRLIDDVGEILDSLGIRSSVTKVEPAISSSGIVGKKRVYIIGFTPYLQIPLQVSRKKIRKLKKRRPIAIKSITPIKLIRGNCIQVSSKEGIYLIGRKLIPTHNSETVSMAVLTRVSTYPEKWAIVAGNKEKAGIIISYIIKHIFDNEYTKSKFILEKGETEESIRRYRNKDKINFNVGKGLLGEVFIVTAANAMGLGAPNVVEDESALVKKNDHALVMRMLGDQVDNFLFKIGNPWESDHFRESREDESYHKVTIDYRQGIKEGRLTSEYVEEMRKQPFFDVLWECKFPPRDTMVAGGWIPLLIKDDIDRAMIDSAKGFGINKLGVDVAGGGRNFSVMVQRFTNYARKVHKSKDPDTMNLAEAVINFKIKENIMPSDIFTDSIGIGKGLYDVLTRTKETTGVYEVKASREPTTDIAKDEFVNLRAEMFWKARKWLLAGGKLERDDDWYQLTKIKYRVKLEGKKGKMQMMSKEDMLKEGIDSPDLADALAMTFVTPDIPPMDPEIAEMRDRQERPFDPHNPFADV